MEKDRKKSIQESINNIHIAKKGVKNNMEGKLRTFFCE